VGASFEQLGRRADEQGMVGLASQALCLARPAASRLISGGLTTSDAAGEYVLAASSWPQVSAGVLQRSVRAMRSCE
jgi:hypothetical protein